MSIKNQNLQVFGITSVWAAWSWFKYHKNDCLIYKIVLMKLLNTFYWSTNSPPYERLEKELLNKSLMNGIKQISPVSQTSCLEWYHSGVNHFAPKMFAYTYPGMYCRLVTIKPFHLTLKCKLALKIYFEKHVYIFTMLYNFIQYRPCAHE